MSMGSKSSFSGCFGPAFDPHAYRALARGDLDLVKPALSNLQRSALRAKDRRRGFDRL
jgi:hypothetical protein